MRPPGPLLAAALALALSLAAGGCESVSVTALEIARIDVSPSEESLLPGGRIQLSATVRDQGGRVLPDRQVSWGSENESIATVASDGLVTAHRAGVVRIVASAGSAQGAAALTVREPHDPDPDPDHDEQESEDEGGGDDGGDGGDDGGDGGDDGGDGGDDGGDDGDDGGNDDDDGDDGDDGDTDDHGSATVAAIDYHTAGGPDDDRHLRITVRIVDASGHPVAGASVTLRTTNLDTNERWDFSESTSGDGTVVLSINHHPAGCYETEVRSVEASGFEWDGATPGNRYCR